MRDRKREREREREREKKKPEIQPFQKISHNEATQKNHISYVLL
jgi:hypothetical protein